MPNGIDDYFKLIHQPWGRIFYDILFAQLDIPDSPRLKLLDYGSGFGVTAEHYSHSHEVIAVEPDVGSGRRRLDVRSARTV